MNDNNITNENSIKANQEASPSVSVIIPVYNTGKYLLECLDSIKKQTLQDFEVICVDDGSTDNSLEILNKYAEHDDRFTVLTQSNQLAGAARNNGIRHARGKYLYFMDSDDFMYPALLEKAASAAEKNNADVVVFGADDYHTLTHETTPHPAYLDYELVKDFDVFSRNDIPEYIFNFSNPAPWTKLYRKDFVSEKNIWFQSLPYTNDVLFTKLAFAEAERIVCINEALTCYRIGMTQNSQSRKYKDPYRYMEALGALKNELAARGLYDALKHSYSQYVVNCLYYELKPYARRYDRIEAYKRVLSDDIAKEAMKIDRDDCHEPGKLDYLNSLLAALDLSYDLSRDKWPEAEPVTESENVIDNPYLSIVIPIYNNAKYVTECLDSITDQRFNGAEIIIVNDGSTDESLDVISDYAKAHDNIRVFTEKNSGPSTARNNGIKNARGTILVMIDSDDLMTENSLKLISENMKDNDLLFYNVKPFYTGNDGDSSDRTDSEELRQHLEVFRKYYKRNADYSTEATTGPELFRQFCDNSEYLPSPVFQAVRRKYFIDNELWFKDGILHEDHMYLFKAILSANKAAIIPDELYLRRVRPESIMTGSVGWRNVYGYYLSYNVMSDFYFNGRNQHGWVKYHQEVYKVLRSVLGASRRDYLMMSPDQKFFWLGLDDREKEMFESLVYDPAVRERNLEKTERHLEKAKAKLRKARKEIRKIKSSKAFRMAEKVSHLPGIFGV